MKGSKDTKEARGFAYKKGQFGPAQPKPLPNNNYHALQESQRPLPSTRKTGKPTKDQPATNNKQDLDGYAVQKMYVGEDLKSFQSSEVRLKQIMLKLKEQERHNQELKKQMMDATRVKKANTNDGSMS